MRKDTYQERRWTVHRFLNGESQRLFAHHSDIPGHGFTNEWSALYKATLHGTKVSHGGPSTMRYRTLAFPKKQRAPQHPLKKPEQGRYHVVRYIRSDSRLNIFGKTFSVPAELQYEYVMATIDVKEQKLKLLLAHEQVDEFKYLLH
jgi:hypothetical protein